MTNHDAAELVDRMASALAASCVAGRFSNLDEPDKMELVQLSIFLTEIADALREPTPDPQPRPQPSRPWWRRFLRWLGLGRQLTGSPA